MTDPNDSFEDRMITLWAEIDSAWQTAMVEIGKAPRDKRDALLVVADTLQAAADAVPGCE